MATKCCTKLEVAEKRCPIVFEGLPSNLKVTQLKKSSILTQIWRFRTVTPVWIHQWLRNYAKAWSSIEEVPCCFLGSSIKFQGHKGWKIDDFNPIWVRLLGRSQLSNPQICLVSSTPVLTSSIDVIFILSTLLDISQEWLVWLIWNEKEMHRLDTGWTMWPWSLTSPMTLTFDFSRSNFKIAVSEELIFDWCETKRKQIS